MGAYSITMKTILMDFIIKLKIFSSKRMENYNETLND